MPGPNHPQSVVSDAFDASTVQEMRDNLGDVTLSQLMACFADDVARAEAELHERDAQADVNGLKSIARNLKGMAGQYGARKLALEASMLENLCAENDTDGLQEKARLVRSLCRQTIVDTFKYRQLT